MDGKFLITKPNSDKTEKARFKNGEKQDSVFETITSPKHKRRLSNMTYDIMTSPKSKRILSKIIKNVNPKNYMKKSAKIIQYEIDQTIL